MAKSLFHIWIIALLAASLAAPGLALQVVAATPELADIARQVGGSKVSVHSVARPDQDYHLVEARPSDVARVARADLVVGVGMDLDLWMDALLNAAGNRQVNRGGPGYVDASVGITKLEVPSEQITGASGDIHVYGNPHYFYDPEQAKVIARNVQWGLERVDPAGGSTYLSNCERFAAEVDRMMAGWAKLLAPYRGRPVVTYHKSAAYFLRRFGLREFDTLEPKPGIPPSAAHLHQLIARMKSERVTAMVVDSIYSRRFPEMVARETGARYVITPYSAGSLGTKGYLGMIDLMVHRYLEALR